MVDAPSASKEIPATNTADSNSRDKPINLDADGPTPAEASKQNPSPKEQPVTTSTETVDTVVAATPAELDIDSMLKDLVNQGGGADPTTTNPEDEMSMDIGSFEDSGDVTSLLPGLENYANIPGTSGSSAQADKADADNEKSKETNQGDNDGMDNNMEFGDSNLDELFNIDELDFGDDNDRRNSMDGNLELGDLMDF
jgi:hypothetical protein